MHIVVAPDSFKGSLTAGEVCDAISEGLKAAEPAVTVTKVPMADGGEGTVQSLVDATDGNFFSQQVEGPLGESVTATFGILGDEETAVIEMAAASGLPLIDEGRRDPMKTTTYGTGELILAALNEGCSELIVGIGGSATTDGGAAMAQALGARFFDHDGNAIRRVSGGKLTDIGRIDTSALDDRLQNVTVKVAWDVDNPLHGSDGAARVYSPQKGASEAEVEKLDDGLKHFAGRLEDGLGIDVSDIPGAGAAGGLGAGLVAFCGAELQSGIDIVVDAVGLREKIQKAGLVITGEGRIDAQTAFGKAPMGAARIGVQFDIPVVAIGGGTDYNDIDELYQRGVCAVFDATPEPMPLHRAMDAVNATQMLKFTAENILRLFLSGPDS